MADKVTKLSKVKKAREKAKERAWKKMTDVEVADHNLDLLVDALRNAPEGAEEEEDRGPKLLGDHSFPIPSAWFLSGQVLVRVLFVDRPVYVDMVDEGRRALCDEEVTFGRAYTADITAWSLNGKTRYFKSVLDPADVEHNGLGIFEISLDEEMQKPVEFDIERMKGLAKMTLARRARKDEKLAALLDRTLYLPDRREIGGSGPIHLVHLTEVDEPLFVSQVRERTRGQMASMSPEELMKARAEARERRKRAAMDRFFDEVFGPPKGPRLRVVK